MLQKEHRKILPTIHPPNPLEIVSSQTTFRYIIKVIRSVKTFLSKA